MNAILWIGGAVLLAVLIGWRLRRAAHALERILGEEADRSAARRPRSDVPSDGTPHGTPKK